MESMMIEGMSDDMVGGLAVGGVLGIGIGVIFMIGIIWYLFQAIANWKLFVKLGEPGWKGFIPFYNDYILYKAVWNVKMFVISLVLVFLVGLSSVGGVFAMIAAAAAFVLIVIEIMWDNNLSKAFGHGVGFTVGLIFFEPIFKLILGFDGSEYIGNPTK